MKQKKLERMYLNKEHRKERKEEGKTVDNFAVFNFEFQD